MNINRNHLTALQYVVNTGGNVDIAGFDEDHEPVGPMLRADLIPAYIEVKEDGKLALTEAGTATLADGVAA